MDDGVRKWLPDFVGAQEGEVLKRRLAAMLPRDDVIEIILVGLEDSQPGVGWLQGVVDEATFRRSSWSWHVRRVGDDKRVGENGFRPFACALLRIW